MIRTVVDLVFFIFVVFSLPLPAESDESQPTVRLPSAFEKPKVDGHWGEEAVGLLWEEDDSRDGRGNEIDVGPFMTSVLPTLTGIVTKGC